MKGSQRVTRRIGAERVAERATAFVALPLVEKFAVPPGVTAPPLAVVLADGGRLQIRDEPGTGAAPPALATAPEAAPEVAEWAEESATACRSGHWREDKVGLLLSMTSDVADTDPLEAFWQRRKPPRPDNAPTAAWRSYRPCRAPE